MHRTYSSARVRVYLTLRHLVANIDQTFQILESDSLPIVESRNIDIFRKVL